MRYMSIPMPETTDHHRPVAIPTERGDNGAMITESGLDEGGEASLSPEASAWSEVEARASALIRNATGGTVADHLLDALNARPGAQILAIGAGAGAVVVELLPHAPDSRLVCIDPTPAELEPVRRRGRELRLDPFLASLDVDRLELEPSAFDLVFCHAALHRAVELEAVVDRIERTLRSDGAFMVVDVVTRSGHAMWPETREVAQAIWKTLPVKFRLNHTAYTTPLIDDAIWEPDPPPPDVKAARPQDIIAAIGERFEEQHFVPYFSLSRRFFDSMYGPNYDLSAPLDRAVFDWIWQLDVHHLATELLRPETFFGIYAAR